MPVPRVRRRLHRRGCLLKHMLAPVQREVGNTGFSWLSSPKPAGECIFYDGYCALCHGIVRFVLKRDQSRQPFCFAPLQGNLAQRTLPEQTRANLPDSVAVLDTDKNVLVRSDAVIYILKRLGGVWFVAAVLFRLLPRGLRDLAYKAVAATRKRIFGTTQ